MNGTVDFFVDRIQPDPSGTSLLTYNSTTKEITKDVPTLVLSLEKIAVTQIIVDEDVVLYPTTVVNTGAFTVSSGVATCVEAGLYHINWGGTIATGSANFVAFANIMLNSTMVAQTYGFATNVGTTNRVFSTLATFLFLVPGDEVYVLVGDRDGTGQFNNSRALLTIYRL